MRSTPRRWISLLLIGSLLLSLAPNSAVCASPDSGQSRDAEGVVDSYLAKALGDTALAALYMADDLTLLSDDITALERQLAISTATNDAWEAREKLTEKEWWEKIADSTFFKVALFCGGVYVGKEMVKVR